MGKSRSLGNIKLKRKSVIPKDNIHLKYRKLSVDVNKKNVYMNPHLSVPVPNPYTNRNYLRRSKKLNMGVDIY